MKKNFCYLVFDSYEHVLGVCDSMPVAEQLLKSEYAFDDQARIEKRIYFTSDDL